MNLLERRCIDLSYKHKLSHIGSVLTSINIIDKIYEVKKKDEPFILSNGHAGLALYVALEKWENQDAEKLLLEHGIHPNRNVRQGIHCSAGSLGSALPMAVGMALGNKNRNVYVLTSDGELAEGSCWEALRIAGDLRLENLRITVNSNGWGAYGKTDTEAIDTRLQYFYPTLTVKTNTFSLPHFLQGQKAHYHTLSEEDYKELMK